jgi:hypothetical protein
LQEFESNEQQTREEDNVYVWLAAGLLDLPSQLFDRFAILTQRELVLCVIVKIVQESMIQARACLM